MFPPLFVLRNTPLILYCIGFIILIVSFIVHILLTHKQKFWIKFIASLIITYPLFIVSQFVGQEYFLFFNMFVVMEIVYRNILFYVLLFRIIYLLYKFWFTDTVYSLKLDERNPFFYGQLADPYALMELWQILKTEPRKLWNSIQTLKNITIKKGNKK